MASSPLSPAKTSSCISARSSRLATALLMRGRPSSSTSSRGRRAPKPPTCGCWSPSSQHQPAAQHPAGRALVLLKDPAWGTWGMFHRTLSGTRGLSRTPEPAIYLGKCSVPAGPVGLVFPDTEEDGGSTPPALTTSADQSIYCSKESRSATAVPPVTSRPGDRFGAHHHHEPDRPAPSRHLPGATRPGAVRASAADAFTREAHRSVMLCPRTAVWLGDRT